MQTVMIARLDNSKPGAPSLFDWHPGAGTYHKSCYDGVCRTDVDEDGGMPK